MGLWDGGSDISFSKKLHEIEKILGHEGCKSRGSPPPTSTKAVDSEKLTMFDSLVIKRCTMEVEVFYC